jgi:hypothetical protein
VLTMLVSSDRSRGAVQLGWPAARDGVVQHRSCNTDRTTREAATGRMFAPDPSASAIGPLAKDEEPTRLVVVELQRPAVRGHRGQDPGH